MQRGELRAIGGKYNLFNGIFVVLAVTRFNCVVCYERVVRTWSREWVYKNSKSVM
jgi:hypothetical protein